MPEQRALCMHAGQDVPQALILLASPSSDLLQNRAVKHKPPDWIL